MAEAVVGSNDGGRFRAAYGGRTSVAEAGLLRKVSVVVKRSNDKEGSWDL